VSLTIRRVGARPVDLALAAPVETAAGVMRSAPLVLIDLDTDEGVTGRSYVRTYTPRALRATAALIEELEEVVVGAPAEPEALEAKLRSQFRLVGEQGLATIAIAGIEMATWDACARAAEVPLAVLLGGEPRPVKAYATLRTMRPEAAAREAEAAMDHGFNAVKLKVGAGDLAADLAAIRAVRAAIGDEAELMVDYNQSLSVDEAIDRARALDEERLAWIEEPTRADDYDGDARIAEAAATPIQLGENWWGAHDMEKSVAAGASDYVTLDVMKLGGVSGWLRAAKIAEQAQLPASSHTFPELSVQLLALTPTCHWLEYLDHAGPILKQPIKVEDGFAHPPDTPGNGLDWKG
jgi:mandelate racemase